MDIERILSEVRKYHTAAEGDERVINFSGFTSRPLPLDMVTANISLYFVTGCSRREFHSAGFLRFYSVVVLDSGTALVEEHHSSEARERMPIKVTAA